jgi:hypothetical protein
MYDPVGYSGTFASTYTGGPGRKWKYASTSIGPNDGPWYNKVRTFVTPRSEIHITLHEELFMRHNPRNWSDTPTIYRYRLILNESSLLTIIGVEEDFAWMNASSKPDEERLITPEGVLAFHSKHDERRQHDDHVTWQGEYLHPIVDESFMCHRQ